MISVLTALLLVSTGDVLSSTGAYGMTCEQTREIAEVIMDDPYLSDAVKDSLLDNLGDSIADDSCKLPKPDFYTFISPS